MIPKVNTVMLIDDDEVDNLIHSRVIKKLDFAKNILVHKSAIKALDFLKNHALALNCWPQIIFLDINMPLMNGFQFLEEIKDIPQITDTKIVVLSSTLNIEDKENMAKNPLVDIFSIKPLKKELLLDLYA